MAAIDEIPVANGSATHTEGSFVNPRQFTIFTQSWVPASPIATLVLVHGLGEYSSRYTRFVNHLTEQKIAVFALDHEAHGRSGGVQEYVEKVQHLVDDVATYALTVHQQFPELPHVIFGHSMGGCISMTLCLQQPLLFDYAIFSAPTTIRPVTVNPVMRALGGVVAKVGPKLRLTPLDTATLCRDPAVVQAYKADPLVWHQNLPVGFGCNILDTGDQLIQDRSRFSMPVLFVSGSADEIVNPAGSLKFFEGCSSQDKTYISLTGWYHELLNEPDGAQLMPFISDWLKERFVLAKGATLATNAHKTGTVGPDGVLIIQPTP
jgi:alpha-beta hydrolase superfamily lysophospholipase